MQRLQASSCSLRGNAAERGAGADGQLAVDLFREQTHAIYAVGRVSLDGHITNEPGRSLFGTVDLFGMWGGSPGAGFRY